MRGGLRKRLILDSTRLAVTAGLEALGWFDPTRKHRPLRYIPRPQRWDVPIEPNAFAISPEDDVDNPQGLGGDVEDRISVYIDVLAENGSVGVHLAYDIRYLVLGKFTTTGQIDNWIDVYDFRQATPTPFTRVEVDDVTVDAAAGQASAWQRYWWMVRLDLVDDYIDEFTPDVITNRWSDVVDTWTRLGSLL